MRVDKARVWAGLLGVALAVTAGPAVTRAERSASATVYVRGDTDHTTVVSPRLRLRSQVQQDTHLDLAYAVDVWTSASVDVVASASPAVTEQRDEINAGLDHVIDDVTVSANYRYSVEPDYESHGGSAGLGWDLANRATTLTLRLGGSADSVSRAGDDDFADRTNTLAAGTSLTQIIDTQTVVQVLYDLSAVRGYQASTYRFIAIGGDGQCDGTAPLCLAESNPRQRMRHAAALRARRALGPTWSIGGGYRAYLDDWGIASHTVRSDAAWAPTQSSTLALSYRFYTQGAADHYKAMYDDGDRDAAYFTRDKELSPLSSHRIALELDVVWELGSDDSGLVTALALAPTFYRYTDFRALDRITALEATLVVGMEYR